MKIAFVDNLAVGGGLSRFSYMLCKSIALFDPSIQIHYFVNGENLQRTPELNGLPSNVKIIPLDVHKPLPVHKRIANKLGRSVGTKIFSERDGMLEVEEKVRGYDLAYFPSAHMCPRPNLSVPVVGTIHDFNWKYFFGQQTFSNRFVKTMDTEVLRWMNGGYTVCSSQDVVDEALKLYPAVERVPEVVHIAPVVFSSGMEAARAEKILTDLGIDFPYLLFPGNFIAHKNHLNLFTAFAILKEDSTFSNYKLLLTGGGSDKLSYGIAERRGVRLVSDPVQGYNVRGMGYLLNEAVDALIKKAKLVVSPSVYEAICTPGMDAWNFGTPTAISDIPPFREHEKVWGIRSAFFDPMDPAHMARVIKDYLINYDKASEDGRISQQNMLKYTWEQVAKKYLSVFEKAINRQAS